MLGQIELFFGGGFTAPVGNPMLPIERETAYRRKIVDKALEALQTEVLSPTVFTVDHGKEG